MRNIAVFQAPTKDHLRDVARLSAAFRPSPQLFAATPQVFAADLSLNHDLLYLTRVLK